MLLKCFRIYGGALERINGWMRKQGSPEQIHDFPGELHEFVVSGREVRQFGIQDDHVTVKKAFAKS